MEEIFQTWISENTNFHTTREKTLQVTLPQFQSIFELSYLPVVCDSIEPPPVIVIVQGAPNCPMQAPTITVWITSGDLAT